MAIMFSTYPISSLASFPSGEAAMAFSFSLMAFCS